MNRRDISEIKKRLTKKGATFTRMRGCYVTSEKEVILDMNETFLNIEENELFKYLEIAKKTLSGTVGNNLLELELHYKNEDSAKFQQFLLSLRDTALTDDALVQSFYEHIIETYQYAGHYLILLFHDAYDVMTKTTDNLKLDESEEVYQYILCAICPVELSGAGLSYITEENKIGPRSREWVVCAPENGFIFPAFTDRSSDIHNIMFYTKDPKSPKHGFMEDGLYCPPAQTAFEQKKIFTHVVSNAGYDEPEVGEQVLMELQQGLNDMIIYHEEVNGPNADPLLLTRETVKLAFEDSELPAEVLEKAEETLADVFGGTPPNAELMIDKKALLIHEQKMKEQSLVKEVGELKKQLKETIVNSTNGSNDTFDTTMENILNTDSIIVKASKEAACEITEAVIDGKTCLVIPL